MCNDDQCLPRIFSRRNQRHRLESADHTFNSGATSPSANLPESTRRYTVACARGCAQLCQSSNVRRQCSVNGMIRKIKTGSIYRAHSSVRPSPSRLTGSRQSEGTMLFSRMHKTGINSHCSLDALFVVAWNAFLSRKERCGWKQCIAYNIKPFQRVVSCRQAR